ncbi:hypothetical protein [Xanthomonas campestris]|uniref:hypothetical protein n=1 Tax=Xanthomonas campestris TaxID=339 RepID=UPI001E567584|nr:hypothetical protein [Xanthomonas campestris]MCC4604848.1 hypothetical protein [Xanthomonas campestris pv. parthenii]
MFDIFRRRKQPNNALDALIFAMYGNPPPPKRANVDLAALLAGSDLLARSIDADSVQEQARALNSGPVPYSTQDLALSVALHFFKQPQLVPHLGRAQLGARLKSLQWLQQGLVAPLLVKAFEDELYSIYRPD